MDEGSRLMLIYWKLRIYFEFYGAKSHKNTFIGLILTLLKVIPGSFKKKHVTRLETVFKNFFVNCYRMFKSQFGQPWISKKEERAMFENWPALFAATMDKKAAGAPELKQDGKINFMKVLKAEHGQRVEYSDKKEVEA